MTVAMHIGYQPAIRCTSGPTPGAKALMSWYLGVYAARGGLNTGIFVCRPTRGSTTTSLHGEGRACDLGVRPYSAQWGTDLAEQLRLNSAALGVQLVIWNRRIWSGSYPHSGWRPYRGVSPHLDHLHVELSRAAAATLTPQRVAQVLGAKTQPEDDMSADFERDVRAMWSDMPKGGLAAHVAKYDAMEADLRGDLAIKGQQIAELSEKLDRVLDHLGVDDEDEDDAPPTPPAGS